MHSKTNEHSPPKFFLTLSVVFRFYYHSVRTAQF
uniref:Uncharacterized protein n=1 Tax=Anguilla anguilla TaxID=7936 RepID=A0A0E9U266_ANGAN